jgi:DNA-binding XRE family transcriptional regulator
MNPTEAIAALCLAGWTEAEIGTEVGANQKTINRYRRGQRQPTWDLGLKIVELARRVSEEGHTPTSRAAA